MKESAGQEIADVIEKSYQGNIVPQSTLKHQAREPPSFQGTKLTLGLAKFAEPAFFVC
jgi:hypothetical protein